MIVPASGRNCPDYVSDAEYWKGDSPCAGFTRHKGYKMTVEVAVKFFQLQCTGKGANVISKLDGLEFDLVI